MTTIFVYGTLKKGQCRGHVLNDSKFLGEAETEANYSLFCNGSYPCLQENGDTAIKGELYEVDDDTMRTLDGIEGVAFGLYKRAEIPIKGRENPAIGYVYLRDVSRFKNVGDHWLPPARV